MKEYIDKDALIKTTENTPFTMSHCLNLDECNGANMARMTLAAIFKSLPAAADVVKVVRCKDCIYRRKAKANGKGFLICPASGMEITEDDYCSYGERKEQNGDED